MAKQIEMDSRLVRAAVWSGVALVVAMILAQVVLMRFVPPPSPTLSQDQIAHIFISRKGAIRAGCLIMCIFWSFWATWGIAITLFIRKMERSYPILTYSSIALVGGGYVFFILIPMTWGAIELQPEKLNPNTLQFMNNWVWFDYLFTWPPFGLWMVVIGLAILKDHNVPTICPRWVAYLNFWCAILIFPAGLIVFFRHGLFAYNGVGAWWIPFSVFFGWMIAMTVVTFQAINREKTRLEENVQRELEPAAV
jgi:hypothetical protein